MRHAIALSLVFAMAGVASAADVNINLTNQATANPGEVVHVDASVSNGTGKDIAIRLLTLDFTGAGNELAPSNFAFDTSSLVSNALYATFGLPVPSEVYTGTSPIPGFILNVPAGGSLHVAGWDVTAPGAVGSYGIDAANAGAPNNNFGARLDHGFGLTGDDPVTTLWIGDGSLGGGLSKLEVVPEPTALALLGMGALALVRRRRA